MPVPDPNPATLPEGEAPQEAATSIPATPGVFPTVVNNTLYLSPGEDVEYALLQSMPVEAIHFEPGAYTIAGPIVFAKPVSLVGSGKDHTVITVTGVQGIAFEGQGEFRIDGITFNNAGQGRAAVEFRQGQFSVSSCRFTSTPESQNSGLLVSGLGTRANINSSFFDQNGMGGIYVEKGANLTLENSLVASNISGIAFFDTASGTVTGNTIAGNQTGILVMEQSTPVIEYNEIYNSATGILVSTTASPRLGENNFHDNHKDTLSMSPE